MMIERYGEQFFIQVMEDSYKDSEEVFGLFLQGSSDERSSASSKVVRGRGRFVTTKDTPLSAQMTLRRASDGAFFRLTGHEVEAPIGALAKLAVFGAARLEEFHDRAL
jgi:hypothetical protein